MRSAGFAFAALLVLTRVAAAQSGEPLYHGVLTINPAHGTMDLVSGNATLKVNRWQFQLSPDTNGIVPGVEPTFFAIGEETFRLADDVMRATPNGRIYTFRAKPVPDRGIRALRIVKRSNGVWDLRFQLGGVDLSSLFIDDICKPFALIVGDDDFFSGVFFQRKNSASRKVVVKTDCDPGGGWPWIR